MIDEEKAEEFANENRVERTENSLIVFLGKEIKYKDKIFELYFPPEFNNNFVLARSIF